MNDDIIDIQAIEEQIVTCPRCGQQNRIRSQQKEGRYHCGTCKAELPNPFTVVRRSPKSFSTAWRQLSKSKRRLALLFSGILAVIVVLGFVLFSSDSNDPERPTVQVGSAGSTALIEHVPDGDSPVLFAAGLDWDSQVGAFTRSRLFAEYDETLDFVTTWQPEGDSVHLEYSVFTRTLQPVPNGNATTTNISEEEFLSNR